MEGAGVALAHAAVDPVGPDQKIAALAQLLDVADLVLEVQLHAEFRRSPLQDREQSFARNSAEAVAARANRVSLEVDLDIVPVGKGLRDLALRRFVGRPQVLQRRIGKDDAPAEGVERAIALVDGTATQESAL